MPAALEMPVRPFRLPEGEHPVDHGAQTVHGYRPVHCLEISATSNADRSQGDAAAGQRGSSPVPDGDRLAPIRLICPPTANVCNDIAIVPGPPISTTQSTPRPFGGPQRVKPLCLLRG